MPAPESGGSGESPGLFSSLRSFWTVLVSILHTRLDLVTAELEEEATRAVKFVAASLVSVLCLHTAFFFLMLLVLAAVWDTDYRLLVLALIFALYFIVGVALLFVARHLIVGRPKFLSQTLAELQRDVDGLRQAAARKDEAHP